VVPCLPVSRCCTALLHCACRLPLKIYEGPLAGIDRHQLFQGISSAVQAHCWRADCPTCMPQLVLERCAVEPPTPDPGEEAVLRLPAGAEDAALASPALLRTGDLHCALFTVRTASRLCLKL
jgi:hypothetical protein